MVGYTTGYKYKKKKNSPNAQTNGPNQQCNAIKIEQNPIEVIITSRLIDHCYTHILSSFCSFVSRILKTTGKQILFTMKCPQLH